jgi:hypothetical protein
MILSFNAAVEAAAEAAGLTFYRTNSIEGNHILNRTKWNDCVCLHVDQTEIRGEVSGTYVYKVMPMEVLFLYKQSNKDLTQTQVDVLQDQAEFYADIFYDNMIQSDVFNDLIALPGYTLSRLEAFKIFDVIATGVLFKMEFPIVKNCSYGT